MVLDADDMTTRLRAELPDALRGGQVIGYFQPEIELSTGRVAAAELLARWEHPELGTLQPSLFLPLAEQLGLMGEFTRLMLRQALVQHRAWVDAERVIPVSVNVGPDCVADPAFPATVAGLLREERAPGQMLTLEVSEETRTGAASARFFAEMAELGVRISLDDFGAGFASLESLGGWPINELKLDESIVRPMVSNANFATIVRTAVDLAHKLGVKVVAEGVESEAVRAELRAIGCDIGQGFFLGPPMTAAAFTSWLRDQSRPMPRPGASGAPQASPPVLGKSGGGPVSEAARSAIRAARRAVQPTGGGTLAAAVAILAAYGLWQVFRWGGREHQVLIGNLAFLPVDWYTALLAWRVSRRADLGHRTCRAWRLIFLATLCFVAGDLLRFLCEVVLHTNGEPAWVQSIYAGCYVFAACGLIAFPARRRSGPERVRLLLDTGTVFLGGAVLIWYVALGPALAPGTRLAPTGLIAFADTVGDLLILFGVLSVLSRGTTRSSVTALRIFAAGMMAFIANDLTYGYIIAHSTYLAGDPVDTLSVLAVTAMWLSFTCQLRAEPAGRIATPPQPAFGRPPVLPYLAVASSYLLLIVVDRHTIRAAPPGVVLLGAISLTFLVSARQYIALRDYGRLADRYQELASIDGMTGLYNRRYFMETAEAALVHAQRIGQPFVTLMIDVDNFKQINDTHGHIAGDQVLTELAHVCREHVRPGDIVGRYGGDEFIIMVPGITSLRAVQLADQLGRPPARVLDCDGKPLAYRVSIGIAECLPSENLPTLLTHADLAMYEAKRAGGNCWRIFGGATGADPAGIGHTTAAPAPPAADRQSAPTQWARTEPGRVARQCARGDDQAELTAGQYPGQCDQDRPVGPGQPRGPGLALEHGDLMAEDQDLGVLGAVGAGEQGEPAEPAEHRQVGQP
jgi:diguanylate cyclase (GGDEF)-like protein